LDRKLNAGILITLKVLVPPKVDCRFINFFRKLMKKKNILIILFILSDLK